MSKTDRIFYHERRKSFQKIKEINIKTDLKEQQINDKLLNYKCQDFNILLNYQIPKKKKSIFSFSNSYKKNKSILNEINEDLNKTEIKFNNMELITDSSFQETVANTSFDSQKYSVTDNNNTFKILLNEDYNTYTDILKKIYPSFEFNHYSKIKDEYYEYYKKYGDNDINNRNSKYSTGNININEKYKQSNLLDILGVQKNIASPPEKFRIKDDFLSRNDITELKMIKDDLSFKTGIIDKELESILESQSNKFYNHIENNAIFVKLISNYSNEIKLKIEKQKIIKKNYMANSMKLLLKEKKKKELEKLLNISYYMNDLKKNIYNIRNLSATSNKNEKIFKEIDENANLAKEKMIYLKNVLNNTKCKFLSDAENIINIYGKKDNLNLVENFTFNLKSLIESCLIYEKKNYIILKDNKTNIKDINKNYWLLEIKEKSFDNILFTGNDFEYFDNDKNIYCKYLLIYNNKDQLNLIKLLLNVLDLLYVIINKKTEINLIISIFKEIFENVIYYNLKEIENKTTNKLLLIKIISNCYSIILSNYCYIICLLKKNFRLNTNNFNEITNLIKKKMNNIIVDLIKSYLYDILEQDWKFFIEGYTHAKNNCEIYFKINKLNWNITTFDFYKKFILDFNESQTRELMNEYNKNNGLNLSWDELNNIDIKYQTMFSKLCIEQNIDKIILKEIDISQKIDINNNKSNLDILQNNNNLIYFINEINEIDSGHKISNFSCLFIKYVYEYLYTYILTNDLSIKKILVEQLYKVSKDLLLYTKDIFINNPSGLINNNKKITEKEISLYYSDLLIIEKCLKNFLLIYPQQDIIDILNQLKNKCIVDIENTIKKINDNIIQELNNISFDNYPSFNDGKEINNYAKYFDKLKKIYDYLGNTFNSEKIKEIFNQRFEILFNDFNKIIKEKGGIKNESGYMQFISDIIFIKKIITIMDLVDYNSFNEILDKCIRDSINITI